MKYGFENDIANIVSWMRRNKVSATTLAQAATNTTSAVTRVLKGKCHLSTLRRILKYVDKHPVVKRPSRAK